MKPQLHLMVSILFTSIFIGSCGKISPKHKTSSSYSDSTSKTNILPKNSNKQNDSVFADPSGEEINKLSIDTSHLVIDTIISFDTYQLAVTKEKYDANHKKYSIDDLDFNHVAVSIIKTANDSVLYKKEYEENQFVTIYSFKERSLNYISLSIYSGGSGYMSNIYKITLGDHPALDNVLSYNELTSSLFNSEGSQILVMQGVWDMSDDGDESHFSEHKYEISTVDLTNNKFERKTIGVTRNKYPSSDYDFSSAKLFKLIHSKEPSVFKGINLDHYPVQ